MVCEVTLDGHQGLDGELFWTGLLVTWAVEGCDVHACFAFVMSWWWGFMVMVVKWKGVLMYGGHLEETVCLSVCAVCNATVRIEASSIRRL